MAFSIVLITIFLKLGFEVERLSRIGALVVVITIITSYVIIAVVGNIATIGLFIDPELVGIDGRSVLNLNGLLILLGTCALIFCTEYAILHVRYIRYICSSKNEA